MRIATWNLEGKWTLRHHHLIESLAADVLLLTEVPDRVAIAGMRIHLTQGEMQPGSRLGGSRRAKPGIAAPRSSRGDGTR